MNIRILLCLLPLAGWSSSSCAHDAIENQVHRLGHQIEAHPQDADLYLQRGRAWLEVRQYDKANADFRQALVLQPADYVVAYFYLAESDLAAGHYDAAEENAQRYLQHTTTLNNTIRANAWWLLGDILAARQKNREAVLAYQHAWQLQQPVSPDMVLRYARVLEQEKQWDQAIAVLESGQQQLGTLPTLTMQIQQLKQKRPQTPRQIPQK
jgi:tetratricopeptide (TPR) repeat protein